MDRFGNFKVQGDSRVSQLLMKFLLMIAELL